MNSSVPFPSLPPGPSMRRARPGGEGCQGARGSRGRVAAHLPCPQMFTGESSRSRGGSGVSLPAESSPRLEHRVLEIMRRILTSPRLAWAVLGIVLTAAPAAAQDFTGDWSGVADGTVATLRIQRDSGGLRGSVHAPSWRAEVIPFSEIATAGDSIML